MKRLNVDIPDELHTALKQQAIDTGESVSDIVRRHLSKSGARKRATLAINPELGLSGDPIQDQLNAMTALSKKIGAGS